MIPNLYDRVVIRERGEFYGREGTVVKIADCEERARIRLSTGSIVPVDYKDLEYIDKEDE